MENHETKHKRMMIIGFDGATFDLIRPWVEAGLLPNFKALFERGAWGPLQSTMPPVTPAAWSSLATGLNMGKHGLFDFYGRKPGSYQSFLVNATNRHGATLWQLLGDAGYRVLVFNVPASYPPDKVNGAMVSGLLTPNAATDASWPREVLEELKQAVPGFNFYPPGVFSKGEEAKFVDDVLHWDQMTLKATDFLMKRQDWDFLFTVFIGVDIMSHFMWREMVTHGASAPTADPVVREKLAHAIESVYRQADDILGKMLAKADDNTYVAVVSDHGFGSLDYYMHLNAWLVQKGYLKFKRTPWVTLKYLAFRLGLTPVTILEMMRTLGLGGKIQETAGKNRDQMQKMIKSAFLSLADVDWSRTTAFGSGFAGPIFVNLKGREPQGIVEPGAAYEALLDRLSADLRQLRHPITGEPYAGEIYRPKKDLYSGPYVDLAADLLLMPRDWSNQGFALHDFASNKWLQPSPDRSGTHRMNGIFYLYGPGIRPGATVEGAGLIDVAPTVLALMGLPLLTSMDGKPLASAFTDELRSQLTITYRDDSDQGERREAPELSSDEERTIRERLEALGYFG